MYPLNLSRKNRRGLYYNISWRPVESERIHINEKRVKTELDANSSKGRGEWTVWIFDAWFVICSAIFSRYDCCWYHLTPWDWRFVSSICYATSLTRINSSTRSRTLVQIAHARIRALLLLKASLIFGLAARILSQLNRNARKTFLCI